MKRILLLVALIVRFAQAGPPPIESPTPASPPEPEPKAAPKAPSPPSVWLERFDEPVGTDLAKLGWEGGQEKDGKRDHFLVKDGARTVMRSSYLAGTEAKYISKEIDVDTAEYPFLRWRWRVRKLPTGGRVLDRKVSDAGAQVYLVWTVGRRKHIVKYYWAANDKVGDELHQSSLIFGKLFGLVLEAGPPLDQWKVETRNVYEDYFRGFGVHPVEHLRALAILSDADETKSESEADYADFQILKKPN